MHALRPHSLNLCALLHLTVWRVRASLRVCVLQMLLLGGNRIRDEGVKAIIGAVRDDRELTTLGLQNNEIGVAGAKEIATAVGRMVTLTDLDLSGNAICGAASTGGGPPKPYTAAGVTALIEAARMSASLRRLNIDNNRLCGVWSDSYGAQQFGTYDVTGVEVVAELLRSRSASTLTHLSVSENAIGTLGGKALYHALLENEACPLKTLEVSAPPPQIHCRVRARYPHRATLHAHVQWLQRHRRHTWQ